MENVISSLKELGWQTELIVLILSILFFNYAVKKAFNSLKNYFTSNQQLGKASFIDALYSPLTVYVWFVAILYIVYLIDHQISENPFCGERPIQLIHMGTIVILGWFLLRWKNRALKVLSKIGYWNKFGLDAHRIDPINKLLTVTLIFIFIVWLLEASGYGIGTLLTIGGIGAAAIAFASKEFIANFFGGFLIYLNQPFAIGDTIRIQGKESTGVVEEIGWYVTRMRDLEKQPIYIPNAMFSQCIVTNLSKRSHRRIEQVVGIRYKDFNTLQNITAEMREYLANHPDIDKQAYHTVNFDNYGESTLDIKILCFTKVTDLAKFTLFKETVLINLYQIVERHGAEFAYQTIAIEREN
jgi:MscS family membrane protein